MLDRVDLDAADVTDGPEPPEEYDPDPEPSVPAARGRRKIRDAVKPSGATINATQRKRLVAELEAYAELAALSVIVRDPVCGQAVHDQARPVAEALAAILARYPDMASKILGTGMVGDWLKLLMAVKPIVAAVWSHHIVRPVDSPAEGVTSATPGPADLNLYPAWRPAR